MILTESKANRSTKLKGKGEATVKQGVAVTQVPDWKHKRIRNLSLHAKGKVKSDIKANEHFHNRKLVRVAVNSCGHKNQYSKSVSNCQQCEHNVNTTLSLDHWTLRSVAVTPAPWTLGNDILKMCVSLCSKTFDSVSLEVSILCRGGVGKIWDRIGTTVHVQ